MEFNLEYLLELQANTFTKISNSVEKIEIGTHKFLALEPATLKKVWLDKLCKCIRKTFHASRHKKISVCHTIKVVRKIANFANKDKLSDREGKNSQRTQSKGLNFRDFMLQRLSGTIFNAPSHYLSQCL